MTAFKSRPFANRLGRRRVLKAAGATAAASVVGMPAIVYGQSGTIKIGVPTIQSGRVALVGQTSVSGLQHATAPKTIGEWPRLECSHAFLPLASPAIAATTFPR